jgi:hypothetical protein
MNASSPAAFALIELVRVALPTAGIALVLVSVFRRYRAAPSRRAAALCVITALWLLVTLVARIGISGVVHKSFNSIMITNWLWTINEFILFLFGVALFIVWRSDRIHLTNRSSERPTGEKLST